MGDILRDDEHVTALLEPARALRLCHIVWFPYEGLEVSVFRRSSPHETNGRFRYSGMWTSSFPLAKLRRTLSL